MPKRSGQGAAALGLAIAGLLTSILGIGLIFAIAAMVCSRSDLREIAASHGQLGGTERALAAARIGRLGAVIAGVVLWLAIMVLPFSFLFLLGDRPIPIVCSTPLPGTPYTVYLHGPDKGKYFYTIVTPDGDCGLRALGAVAIGKPADPQLEDLGSGVFRVRWGKPPNTAFATIDTTQRLIVADSNPSNRVNQRFDTPRYLRPGYPRIPKLREATTAPAGATP